MNNGKRLLTIVQKRTFFGIPEYSVKGKQLLEFENGKAEHAKKTAKLWKNLFFYTGIPVILVAAGNTYKLEKEHFEHLEHHPMHYKDLPYFHIRKKPFPWGDGYKSFFYNEKVQPRE